MGQIISTVAPYYHSQYMLYTELDLVHILYYPDKLLLDPFSSHVTMCKLAHEGGGALKN